MAEPYTCVALSPLRKVIAARMTQAQQTVPQFRIVSDVAVDTLAAWRERSNMEGPATRLSLSDCIVKACAAALLEHPSVNVQLNGDQLHKYHDADISLMVAVPGGVAAPIIRGANRKDIWQIACERSALADSARAGRLRMEDIVGGSFSVSNLGGYGVDQFDAIVNPPQCAILAVGRARPCMVVSDAREAGVATIMRTTLTADHRAIDGATAAAFLRTLRSVLESPAALFRRSCV